MTNCNWSKIPKNHTIKISSGCNIIFSSTGKLVAIVKFNPFSSMSELDFNNLNKLSQFLFNQCCFLTKITINKTIKSGEMWAIGWRKSMTKGELYGLYGTTKNIQNHQAAWDDQKQDLDEAGKILANGFKKLANGFLMSVMKISKNLVFQILVLLLLPIQFNLLLSHQLSLLQQSSQITLIKIVMEGLL